MPTNEVEQMMLNRFASGYYNSDNEYYNMNYINEYLQYNNLSYFNLNDRYMLVFSNIFTIIDKRHSEITELYLDKFNLCQNIRDHSLSLAFKCKINQESYSVINIEINYIPEFISKFYQFICNNYHSIIAYMNNAVSVHTMNEIYQYATTNSEYNSDSFIRCMNAIIKNNSDVNLNCILRPVRRRNVPYLRETIQNCGRINYVSDLYNIRDAYAINRINAIGNPNVFVTSQYDQQLAKQYKYIHSFDYKPNYVKHLTENDDDTALLLGVEIEVDEGGKCDDIAQECLTIMNSLDEQIIYCMHDGSLRCGFEIVTMPCTMNYHRNLPYQKLFTFLDSKGYKSHDTNTCGLHIHVNRTYFGESIIKQQLAISKLLYLTEKFNDEVSVIGRRDCKYSTYLGYKNNETPVDLFLKNKTNHAKYAAINTLHENTIEFRMFKGTLKYSTLINTLEFVSVLCRFVKDTSIEDIDSILWENIMNYFSEDLLKYYLYRLTIKKNENNSDNQQTIVTPYISHIDTISLEEICREHNNRQVEFISSIGNATTFEFQLDSRSTSDMLNILLNNNSDDNNSNQTKIKIKQLKEEISNLKKQTTYQTNKRNFMIMKTLNKQINTKQKELKNLIKANNKAE